MCNPSGCFKEKKYFGGKSNSFTDKVKQKLMRFSLEKK